MKTIISLKLFTSFLLLIFANTLFAQMDGLAKIRYDKFNQVFALGSNIITFNGGSSFDEKVMKIYDASGKELKSLSFTLKSGYELLSSVSLGSKSVFFISGNKSHILLVLDQKGLEVKRIAWTDIEYKNVKLLKIDENNFYFIGDIKEDSPGFSVKKYSSVLEELWTYKNVPLKNKYFAEFAAVNNNGELGLVYRIKGADFAILSLDNQGQVVADKPFLTEGLTSYEPYFFEANKDNNWVLASDAGLLSSDLFSSPTKLNIKTFSKTGDELSSQNFDFKMLNDSKILPESNFWTLRVLDLVTANNQELFICESFVVNTRTVSQVTVSSTTPTNVNLYDVSFSDLFILDANNINNTLNRIWKPNRNLTIKGMNSFQSVRSIGKILQDNKLFSFQFFEANKIYVRGFSQNFEYINTIDIQANADKVLTRKYWGKPISATKIRTNNQNIFALYNNSSTYGATQDLNKSGLLNLGETKIVYYMNYITGNLEFSIYK